MIKTACFSRDGRTVSNCSGGCSVLPGVYPASMIHKMPMWDFDSSLLIKNKSSFNQPQVSVREVRTTCPTLVYYLTSPQICPEDQGASVPSTDWCLVIKSSQPVFYLSALTGFIHQVPSYSKGTKVLLLGSGSLWYLAYLSGYQMRQERLGEMGNTNILWSRSDQGWGRWVAWNAI